MKNKIDQNIKQSLNRNFKLNEGGLDREIETFSDNSGNSLGNGQDAVQAFLEVQRRVYEYYMSLPRAQRRLDDRAFWLYEEASRYGRHATTGQIIGYPRQSEEPIVQSPAAIDGLTKLFRHVLYKAEKGSE